MQKGPLDIAVIGMAGRFPKAKNPGDFWNNLVSGTNAVSSFPESRVEELRRMFGEFKVRNFIREGYLDHIFQFEPEIFSLSQEECRYMDPQQRLLLELVEETFLDAGYNPQKVKEEVGVFLAENRNEYHDYIEANQQMMGMINQVPSSGAGRVAYTFDLRGPVFTVGSACSSSLAAVHTACQYLITEQVSMAIAGGVRLLFIPPDVKDIQGNPLVSPDQVARSYDERANGTIGGEGGGIVLLKSLSDALEDGDVIHAIIKGSAVNNDGYRSNGMNAPSQEGQRDVILQAVHNAQIDPLTLSFIEGHGTGTPLGDSVELEGVTEALRQLGYPNTSVPISSVKSNIGHLDVAAGVAGLIKAILSLKHGKLPPSLHYHRSNIHMAKEQSPIYVNRYVSDWSSSPGRAGVTSLSFIGTNVHTIVEEAPSVMRENNKSSNHCHIVSITARTERSLQWMIHDLAGYLKEYPQLPVDDVAFTLNTGRREFGHRCHLMASSTKELAYKLESGEYSTVTPGTILEHKAAVLIPGLNDINGSSRYPLGFFSPVGEMAPLLQKWKDKGEHEAVQYIKMVCAWIEAWTDYSVKPAAFLGFGTGKHLAEYFTGRIDMDECVNRVVSCKDEKTVVQKDKLNQVLQSMMKQSLNLFFMPFSCPLASQCKGLLETQPDVAFFSPSSEEDSFYKMIMDLLSNGLKVDWNRVYRNKRRNRVSLPGYVFDRREFFLPSNRTSVREETLQSEWAGSDQEIEKKLVGLLEEVYSGQELDLQCGFFELGISSVVLLHLIGKIEREFGVSISIDLFFEDTTTEKVIEKIKQLILDEKKEEMAGQKAQKMIVPATSAQKRIYSLHEEMPENVNYNMMFGAVIHGELDLQRFRSVLEQLIQRHESLRTSLALEGEQIVQRVHPDIKWKLEKYRADDEENLDRIADRFLRPFDLSQPPLFRTGIVEMGEKRVWLFDIHHIVSDGTSMEVLLDEFLRLYQGEDLPAPGKSYRDFALWEQELLESERIKEMETYWLRTLSDPPLLQLPTDFSRPSFRSYRGKDAFYKLSPERTKQLRVFAGKNGVTLFMSLLAVYAVLLYKYTQQEDLIIGTFHSGRVDNSFANTFGMFVNTLPIRCFPTSGKTFSEFLQELKGNLLRGFQHQKYPLEKLMQKLNLPRNPARNPLFDVAFNYQESPFHQNDRDCTDAGFSIEPRNLRTHASKFDLQLDVIEMREQLVLKVQYCTDLYKKETIEKFMAYYDRILQYVLENGEILLEDIELASIEDRKKSRKVIEFNL